MSNTNIDLSREQSASFNPIENIKSETDFIMSMLIKMANVTLSEAQLSLAKRIALDEADKKPLTILRLVEAMDSYVELRDFSTALSKAALPGYCRDFIEINMSNVLRSKFETGQGLICLQTGMSDAVIPASIKFATQCGKL